jgi:hypothetical protein
MSTPTKGSPPLTHADFHLVREPGMELALVTGLRLTCMHRFHPAQFIGRNLIPHAKKAGVAQLRHALYGPLPEILGQIRYLVSIYDTRGQDSDSVLKRIDALMGQARAWMNAEPAPEKFEETFG